MNEAPAPPSVFFSYSRADSSIVKRLRTDLHTQGIATWMDREGIQPGTPDWEESLRMAIRAAHAVMLVASPNARSSRYVKDELRIAQMYQRPIYPIWVTGTQWMEAIPLGLGGMQYIDAREERYASALSEIVTVLNGDPFAPTPATDDTPPNESERGVEPRNPYKGLRAFTSADAHDFFGRDILIQELLEALKVTLAKDSQSVQSARLLSVIGPSGSGKSSVVMAGLLPCLRGGGVMDSQEWVYLDSIVPGTHPMESLTLALSEKLRDKSLKTIREDLEDDSARGLHLYGAALAKPRGIKVVLFVDQFEELFTLTTSEDERRQFVDLLLSAITEPHGPVILILTLRADFTDRPMQYPELYRLIDAHHSSVLPMEMNDLRSVIEQPATLPDVQLTFEGDLVGDLLFEMRGQTAALPLLQFTLDQLFQRRSGRQLTLQSYLEIGGVKGALAKQAEATYVALPSEEHRRLTCALFLRLIDPGITEQDTTRRRATLSEFEFADELQTLQAQEAREAFVRTRLLTIDQINDITTVEVSHEAVIREWKRLAEWLHEARDDIRFQQDFSEDVVEWEQRKRPKDRLYRGTHLKEAQDWSKRNIPSEHEGAFLHASAFQQTVSIVRIILVLCLLVLSGGGLTWYVTHLPPVSPSPTLVTNLKDDGSGSLRWSIASAHSGSTIKFAPNIRGTIKLISNDISIDKNLVIQGPGANLLAISSTGPSIQVSPRASVTISGLSFKDSTFTNTGFIVSEGNLTVTNSTFSNLQAQRNLTPDDYGSSLTNRTSGNIIVTNSTFLNNSSQLGSGAIESTSIGNIIVTNSTFLNNSSRYGGGAIDNVESRLTVTNSTFSNNQASYGGAINSYSNFTAINSTFSNNQAQDRGGAIALEASGPNSFLFCTIYGNQSSSRAGGIWIEPGVNAQSVTLTNSIVAANEAPTGPNIAGTLTTGGNNLIQDFAGAIFLDPNGRHATDKEMKLLSDLKIDSQLSNNDKLTQTLTHGGHTQILKLQQDSPAIDAIPLAACLITVQDASDKNIAITTDQLHDPRPDEPAGKCDIGSYESSY